MTTPCISCRHFTLKGSPEAEKGRGFCKLLPRNVLLHIEKRNYCPNYRAVSEVEAQQRMNWWEKKRQTTTQTV